MQRVHGQGSTAFTYQGQLHDSGTNANGTYTIICSLYDAVTGGNQIGSTVTSTATLVNGLFTVNLDFGASAFTGAARWLDITVTNSGDSEELSPRVQVLPAPYALYASNAASLASSNWDISVGNYQSYSNVFGIFDGGSLVMGMTSNGIYASGNLQASGLNIGNTSLNSDGNGGLVINDSVSITSNSIELNNASISVASNADVNDAIMVDAIAFNQGGYIWNDVSGGLNLHGSGNFSFDTDTSNDVHFDGGNFYFENNIEISALGVLTFPGPDGGGGSISGDNSGLLMSSGLQINGALSVIGDMGCSGCIQGTFCQNSDRNLKEKFTPVNPRDILDRVAGLPISSWNYKTDGQARHIGPMAQDFHAAFNTGADDKHIATVDEEGVALAAIQGLNEKLKEKDAQINALEKRLSDLEALVKASNNK